MNLWIRSQNKEELVLVTRIYLQNTNIRAIDFKGYSVNIGIYESRERAIEIIDEIQNKLQDKFLCKPTALLKPEDLLKQEYELYEKGDKVLIYDGEYEGQVGIVMEDQIDRDFMVRIWLGREERLFYSDHLDLIQI